MENVRQNVTRLILGFLVVFGLIIGLPMGGSIAFGDEPPGHFKFKFEAKKKCLNESVLGAAMCEADAESRYPGYVAICIATNVKLGKTVE